MSKIIAPNKNYNGVSASVQFKNGIGETSDNYLIEWFKKNGYEVQTHSESSKEVILEDVDIKLEEKPMRVRKGKE